MLKIITTGFNYGQSTAYQIMTDVLIYSIEKNCPKAVWVNNWLEEPEQDGRIRGFVSNTVKLESWVEELELCNDGDHVIFMDCDMLVLSDLSSAFKEDFDVAYTYRNSSTLPLNGGVIFAKKNKKSLAFFKRFLEINNKMFKEPEFHQTWRNKYAGINQAAFGYMLEEEPNIVKMGRFPCSTWNVCQEYQDAIKNGAKVLHVKGPLRKAVFSHDPNVDEKLTEAIKLWRQHKMEMENDRQFKIRA